MNRGMKRVMKRGTKSSTIIKKTSKVLQISMSTSSMRGVESSNRQTRLETDRCRKTFFVDTMLMTNEDGVFQKGAYEE